MNSLPEVWLDVEGFEGFYQVSNHGRVKSLSRQVRRGEGFLTIKPRTMRPTPKSNGYLHLKLSNGDASIWRMVHQLVAAAFLNRPSDKHIVNHIDGDRTNNHVSNLEYVTYSENSVHAFDMGLMASGERSSHAIYSADTIRAIRKARGERTVQELAEQFGISYEYVRLILSRRRWARLSD